MMHHRLPIWTRLIASCLLASLAGCRTVDYYTPALQESVPPELQLPCELSMVSLPAYRIEPPDMLSVEVLRLVPRPDYRIEPQDVLQIHALNTMIDEPLEGYFLVESDGIVNLGPAYGSVRVVGMTVHEAAACVTGQLRRVLAQPGVQVQLARTGGTQQLTGTYLVEPDGVVNLHGYGMASVAGMTVTEARVAIERHLSEYFDAVSVGVDVVAYNSKFYYVVTATTNDGENIQRFPVTGRDTVLDAIGGIGGLSKVSSKTMWLSRPSPVELGAEETFPVSWEAIARGGETETNYQLMPGDRVYIVDDKLVAANDSIMNLSRPIERLLSIANLGTRTVGGAQVMGRQYNLNRRY